MHEAPAVLLILAVTFGFSYWAFENPAVEEKYLFRPESILAGKEYYRLVTSALVHAGWWHLLLNLYTLQAFAGSVVWTYGQTGFLIIYLGSVVGGSLLALYVHRFHDYAAYGASGGVCGIIFAHILRSPSAHMALFPLPYAVPGWLFAAVFMVASFYAMKAQRDDIGHDAHLGGAMVGLLLAAALQPKFVQRSWVPFIGLLLLSVMILVYLWVNPLFLPLTVGDILPFRRRKPKLEQRSKTTPVRRGPSDRIVSSAPARSTDWLIEKIEAQVGTLQPDPTGRHSWIDKFGRAYAVIPATTGSFDFAKFKETVLGLLATSEPQFVIVDTRQLAEDQVALIRPFIADLPDAQFYRVIRSYAFESRKS